MHGLTPPKHHMAQFYSSTMYSVTRITLQTQTEHQHIQF
ncbi:hypothetical protein ID866_10498 [Astraeus odoratus]|nr:hypothetical protein ID866_10498 [Astraeus odoratus]